MTDSERAHFKAQLEKLKARSVSAASITYETFTLLNRMSVYEASEVKRFFVIVDEFHRAGSKL